VPPRTGPYILVANHQGWADGFLLIGFFPAEPRLHFFADQQGTTGTWWKALMVKSLGGIVRVDRTAAVDRSAVDVALRFLAEGAVLAMFPEGRVSRAEAQLAPFERGVAYLAIKAGVPVLPVWLRGTAELYLGRDLVARVGKLRQPPAVTPTKQATSEFATVLYEDVLALSAPWEEPVAVRKRWRWLTNIL
jgi:1-acyl-sn-glycerol-3-phosphate acyltransferase